MSQHRLVLMNFSHELIASSRLTNLSFISVFFLVVHGIGLLDRLVSSYDSVQDG